MYTPNCDIFWVGSYPFKDPRVASRRILRNSMMLLHWPQLPKRSKLERTVEQTYAALEKMILDKTPTGGFPKGAASGWSATFSLLKKKRGERGSCFKTQIAGPITLFGKLQTRQSNQQKLLDYVTLWLKHAYWQIDQIQEAGFKPLVVLDEPLLPTYMGPSGSAQARKTLRLLRSIVKRIKKHGALVGIHCCNRISPETLIDLGVDLIHFDAYYFPTQITRARESLQRFLIDGGIVAWGIIPIDETLTPLNQAKLEKNFTNLLVTMETRGLPLKRVLAQSMVAPSCGTGALTAERNDQIVGFATTLSRELKKRYKLSCLGALDTVVRPPSSTRGRRV